MTMTETIEAPAKKRRKYKRRAVARTIPKEPVAKASAEFAGMTATECCVDCRPDRCVITGMGICGHPMKGGLQAPLMCRAELVDRYNRARKVLAHTKVDKLP